MAERRARVKPLSAAEKQTLTGMGKELYEYLYQFKRETYREMQQDGTLLQYLQSEGERLEEMVVDLMQNGMDQAGALELTRAEYNPDVGAW